MTQEIPVEEIINAIKDLSLKAALVYLVRNRIFDFSKKGFEKIKKIIQDKQNEAKYAFVPDKEEANQLKQLFGNPGYAQVRLLVPKYRYIDIIRSGLLVAEYHRINTEKSNKRVAEIKRQVAKRPNGDHLLKILNLPTTPFFAIIMKYMYNLKVKGYSDSQLEDAFDELVSRWEKTSKFVKSENKIADVTKFCENQIAAKTNVFFILGMKNAAEIVEKALEKMEKENLFGRNSYSHRIIKETEGCQPRIEITVFECR